MCRISVRALMTLVVAAAIGLAAVRNADAFWGVFMLLIALSAIDAAVIGAVLMRGRGRNGDGDETGT
jgi:hypothetical protein